MVVGECPFWYLMMHSLYSVIIVGWKRLKYKTGTSKWRSSTASSPSRTSSNSRIDSALARIVPRMFVKPSRLSALRWANRSYHSCIRPSCPKHSLNLDTNTSCPSRDSTTTNWHKKVKHSSSRPSSFCIVLSPTWIARASTYTCNRSDSRTSARSLMKTTSSIR